MKTLIGLCGLILAVVSGGAAQLQEHQDATSPYAKDCTEIKKLKPKSRSGTYIIQPDDNNSPFEVYCEMLSDGGWTVIQRRTGASVSFDRIWNSYENGFGQKSQDHWLGLKKMYLLTKSRTTTLRVNLWDHEGGSAYAEYKNFYLDDRSMAYKLHVGAYSGTAGDAIRGAYSGIDQNGMGFSTKDSDNDNCDPVCIFGDIAISECATEFGGGWWFSRCGSAELNGDYHATGDHIGWRSGLHWGTWKSPVPYSMKASRMMVKSV